MRTGRRRKKRRRGLEHRFFQNESGRRRDELAIFRVHEISGKSIKSPQHTGKEVSLFSHSQGSVCFHEDEGGVETRKERMFRFCRGDLVEVFFRFLSLGL